MRKISIIWGHWKVQNIDGIIIKTSTFGVAWEYQHICLIMKDNYWSIFDWYLCYVQWLYYDGYKGYEVMILLIVLYWDSLHLTCIYYHILNEDIELHHHNNLINFVYYVDLEKFIPYYLDVNEIILLRLQLMIHKVSYIN